MNIKIGQIHSEHINNCVDIVDGNGLKLNENSDFIGSTVKEDERNNTTVKKSPSTNLIDSEHYYFLELTDISENDGGKINVNPTECDNVGVKDLKEGKILKLTVNDYIDNFFFNYCSNFLP